MRFICGYRNKFVMILNSSNCSATIFTLEGAIKSSKINKILGITDNGISTEDFLNDVVSKAVVYSSDEFCSYAEEMIKFGAKMLIKGYGTSEQAAKYLKILQHKIPLYTSERRSYAELMRFMRDEVRSLSYVDARVLGDRYIFPAYMKNFTSCLGGGTNNYKYIQEDE